MLSIIASNDLHQDCTDFLNMDLNSLSSQQKDAVLQRMKQEQQGQIVQELMNKITESCFTRCAGSRGDGLDNRERECMANCMGRYIETMTAVQEAIAARSNR
jgi:mitochondrial import inner membrane translocase subunit TIM13